MGRVVLVLGLAAMFALMSAPNAAAAKTGTIALFSGFRPDRGPQNLIDGPDGNLWFTEADAIGRITPQGQITEFTQGLTSAPYGPTDSDFRSVIVRGPDANLWFTAGGAIGRITPQGQITEYAANRQPGWLVAGPDGNLWFSDSGCLGNTTQQCVSAIARITPQGQIKEFPDIAADHLAAGPDGNVWFFGGPVQNQTGPSPSPTTQPREQLGRITPQGQVTEFDLGGPKFPATGLVALPDGNLWFSIAGSVGRITPQGQVTHFPVGGVPAWGPDGNVWAAGGNAIARITPQGQITRFSNGFADPQRGPSGDVVAGSDGNLWFTEGSPDDPGIPPKPGIGRITPQGQITEYTQGLKPFPLNLVSGPDGNMWFLDNGSIGRITVGRTGNPKVGRATVKGTAARIPISCKGSTGSSCELTATLTVTEKLRGGKVIAVTAASAMPKPKVVVLGTDTVSITAGQRKTVRIAMNAVGRQLLARRRALKVKLAITQPRGGKNRLVYSQKLTFKANRRGK